MGESAGRSRAVAGKSLAGRWLPTAARAGATI